MTGGTPPVVGRGASEKESHAKPQSRKEEKTQMTLSRNRTVERLFCGFAALREVL